MLSYVQSRGTSVLYLSLLVKSGNVIFDPELSSIYLGLRVLSFSWF